MSDSVSGITSVLVAGAGTMGQRIAIECIRNGFDVRMYDTDPNALVNAIGTREILNGVMGAESEERIQQLDVLRSIKIETSLAAAVRDVDMVMECIPERLGLKKSFFSEVSQACPATAILATNTSVLLPSKIAEVVVHPERFIALHFLNEALAVEVMPHPGTDSQVVERIRLFSLQLGHRPVIIGKEKAGHIINSMLLPLNYSAIALAANGVGTPEDIDRLWMMCFGTSFGPLGNVDFIGIDTALDVTKVNAALTNDPQMTRNAEYLQSFVDKGRLGVKTLGGFYDYPNPSFSRPDFLKFERLPGPKRRTASPSQTATRRYALVDGTVPGDADTVAIRLDPRRDCFWRDHVMKGTPLLPAAALVEMIAESIELRRPGSPYSLKNLRFVNGIRSFNGQPQNLFITFNGDDFAVYQEFRDQSGTVVDARRLCVTGTVAGSRPMPAPPTTWPTGLDSGVGYIDDSSTRFGPTMRGLRRVILGETTGAGEIVVPSMARICPDRAGREFVHSIPLIDAAFVCCNLYTELKQDGAWQLPIAVGEISLGRAPHDEEVCWAALEAVPVSNADAESEFDLSVFGADGECLLAVRGYRCHIMRTADGPGIRIDALAEC